MNKEYKKEMLNSMSDNTAAAVIEEMLDNIGKDLSNIINQDGELYTDGNILDIIIAYLTNKGLYYDKNN